MGVVRPEEHPRSRSDRLCAVIRPSGCFMDLGGSAVRRAHTPEGEGDRGEEIRDMSTQQQLDDHIIERYTAQPTRLPLELRREIEHAWHGAPIQLYALADLDQSLVLAETWFALGPRHIAVAKRDSEAWHVRSIEGATIDAVGEGPGWSAHT